MEPSRGPNASESRVSVCLYCRVAFESRLTLGLGPQLVLFHHTSNNSALSRLYPKKRPNSSRRSVSDAIPSILRMLKSNFVFSVNSGQTNNARSTTSSGRNRAREWTSIQSRIPGSTFLSCSELVLLASISGLALGAKLEQQHHVECTARPRYA